MQKNKNEEIALFRYSVIAPLITNVNPYRSNSDFFKEEAKKERLLPTGEKRIVPPGTIEKWYYCYNHEGFDGLLPKCRSDYGKFRKLSNDDIKYIESLYKKYPKLNAKAIHCLVVEKNVDMKGVSYTTVLRVVNRIKENEGISTKEMLRYESEHINQIWCADTSFGLFLYVGDKKIKLCIIAFIDDASRLIVAAKICDSDNVANLISTFEEGVIKFGIPQTLNMDNGKNYRSKQMSIIAAKLGTSLYYDPVHTPTSKAKIERFFRTLKDQWLSKINFHDFKSIEEYQKSLNEYISIYNSRVHSSLDGLSPMDRFTKEINLVRRKPLEDIKSNFLLELERRVTNDGIVYIDNVEFQCPPRYYKRSVVVAYQYNLDKAYIKESNQLIELSKVDKVANSQVKRKYNFGEEDD